MNRKSKARTSGPKVERIAPGKEEIVAWRDSELDLLAAVLRHDSREAVLDFVVNLSKLPTTLSHSLMEYVRWQAALVELDAEEAARGRKKVGENGHSGHGV